MPLVLQENLYAHQNTFPNVSSDLVTQHHLFHIKAYVSTSWSSGLILSIFNPRISLDDTTIVYISKEQFSYPFLKHHDFHRHPSSWIEDLFPLHQASLPSPRSKINVRTLFSRPFVSRGIRERRKKSSAPTFQQHSIMAGKPCRRIVARFYTIRAHELFTL